MCLSDGGGQLVGSLWGLLDWLAGQLSGRFQAADGGDGRSSETADLRPSLTSLLPCPAAPRLQAAGGRGQGTAVALPLRPHPRQPRPHQVPQVRGLERRQRGAAGCGADAAVGASGGGRRAGAAVPRLCKRGGAGAGAERGRVWPIAHLRVAFRWSSLCDAALTGSWWLPGPHAVYALQVRSYAVEVLQKTDDEELLYYLLQLVQVGAGRVVAEGQAACEPPLPSSWLPLPAMFGFPHARLAHTNLPPLLTVIHLLLTACRRCGTRLPTTPAWPPSWWPAPGAPSRSPPSSSGTSSLSWGTTPLDPGPASCR